MRLKELSQLSFWLGALLATLADTGIDHALFLLVVATVCFVLAGLSYILVSN